MNATNINYEKVCELKFAAASKVKAAAPKTPWFKEGVDAFYSGFAVTNPYSTTQAIERSEFIRGYDSVASGASENLFDCD